jgi:hypothetical protein
MKPIARGVWEMGEQGLGVQGSRFKVSGKTQNSKLETRNSKLETLNFEL